MKPIIVTTNGLELDLDNMNVLLGYQIIHKTTGRLFPTCTRFEIYTEKAANDKIFETIIYYRDTLHIDLKTIDYELEPIYENEIESGYHLITSKKDWRS